jgi:hypothetical protein
MKMDSTSSLRHKFWTLHVLYFSSVLVLLPFAILFAFLVTHGWDRTNSLFILLPVAVGCALLVWSILEPLLQAKPDARINVEPSTPQTFEQTVLTVGNPVRAPLVTFGHTVIRAH